MIILHVAWLDNNKSNGVSVVVPQHVKYQSKIANVALFNISLFDVTSFSDVGDFCPIFSLNECPNGDISKLAEPFNRPDIVVFHGVYFYFYTRIIKHLIRHKIPYIIVPHGSLTYYSQKRKTIKKWVANHLIFDKYIRKARAVQYLTVQEKDSSKWRSSFIISGNGMDFPSTHLCKRVTNKKSFNLTYIGRIAPFQKGLDLLIEGCLIISSTMREENIKLSIYGPDDQGGKQKVLNLIEKHNLQDIIFIYDPVFENEKKEVLQNTDIFLLTSRFEGQPLAIIEALFMGVPVIITPGTNIAEEVVTNKCGWYAESTSESIASKIIEAYNSSSHLTQYSKNAIKFATKTYSWEKLALSTVQIYEELVKEMRVY